MQKGSGVTNLQTELNYLDSFKSYCNSSDLGFLRSGGVGQVGGGCPEWSAIVYMSSGMFRGKESSNRIELSQLVQDLLNFGVLGSLRLWGGGRLVGGIWGHRGCCHTHAHACTHARTCTHAHLYMYRNCKWPLTWRNPCLACLTCMCVRACVCVHACACVHAWDTSHPSIPTPTPIHPSTTPPRGGGPPESLKIRLHFNLSRYFNSVWRFEICEEFPTHGWVCGLVGVWVVGWVDGWGQVKSLKI